MNNHLHIQTKILIRSMIRQLMQCLEVANRIEDKDTKQVAGLVKAQERNVRHVIANIERGNVWLTLYYLREILEETLLSDEF